MRGVEEGSSPLGYGRFPLDVFLVSSSGRNDLSFSCSAESYTSPVLHCSLTDLSHPSLVRVKSYRWVLLIRVRRTFCPFGPMNDLHKGQIFTVFSFSSTMNQDWKEMKTLQEGDPILKFNVTLPGFCPYEEQVDPINVDVEVLSGSDYRSGHKSFYMRDIGEYKF